jgi:hypothetical protein
MNAFQRTSECLEIDELVGVLDGADEQHKRRVESHIAGCAHCRTELALFRGFESAVVRPEEQRDVDAIVASLRKRSPAAPEPWWKSIWWKSIWKPRLLMPAGLATAAAMIAIMIGIQHRPGQLPISGDEQVMRSSKVTVVSPVGDLPESARSLAWRAVSGAARYRVSILEVDRTELWSTMVQQTNASVPAAVVQKMAPLKTLFWNVQALDSSGSVIAESGLTRFRVMPR